MSDWDYDKNDCKPGKVEFGSKEKYWWKCKNGHEWQATPKTKFNTGCIYCLTKSKDPDKTIGSKYPNLVKEWDYDKNGGYTPSEVAAFSNKKAWWICEHNHRWDAVISTRTKGAGCPYCSGLRLLKENSLMMKNPELSKEWHPTKNGSLTPEDVPPFSDKKVWWKCKNGHEWKAKIYNRSNGRKCPYCSGKLVNEENCLSRQNPNLAKEWNVHKNKKTPNDYTPGSNKIVWWRCEKEHEWEASINSRNSGSGCPYCVGQKTNVKDSLACKYPLISKEWHPTKNDELTTADVLPGSSRYVWWKCQHGHEWQARINERVNGRGNCKSCSSLGWLYPNLAEEWDHEKNKGVTTYDVAPYSSNEKYWWKCKNCNFSWQSTTANRQKGNGCPNCSLKYGTSFPEQTIFYYIRQIYNDTINREKLDSIKGSPEADIFIPSLKLAIEYDGFHHKKRMKSDEDKTKKLMENGIDIIRIRDDQLPEIKGFGSLSLKHLYPNIQSLKSSIYNVMYYIEHKYNKKIKNVDIDIERDKNKILDMYYNDLKDRSLLALFPEVAKQWDYEKNYPLKPEQFSSGSNHYVWWKCEQGHEQRATISNKVKLKKCIYCKKKFAGIRKIQLEDSLFYLRKDVIEYWDQQRNDFSPKEVVPTSTKKSWWKCKECHSTWEDKICNVTKRKRICLHCYNNKNSLQTNFPRISKEWHPTHNGALTPTDVSKASGRKVWWLCEKGHEWQATIASRTGGNNCPYCGHQKASAELNLAKINPVLSEEWNYQKNNGLTPYDVLPFSDKKVWWKCKNGHEWPAVIKNRSRGRGCPHCFREK